MPYKKPLFLAVTISIVALIAVFAGFFFVGDGTTFKGFALINLKAPSAPRAIQLKNGDHVSLNYGGKYCVPGEKDIKCNNTYQYDFVINKYYGQGAEPIKLGDTVFLSYKMRDGWSYCGTSKSDNKVKCDKLMNKETLSDYYLYIIKKSSGKIGDTVSLGDSIMLMNKGINQPCTYNGNVSCYQSRGGTFRISAYTTTLKNFQSIDQSPSVALQPNGVSQSSNVSMIGPSGSPIANNSSTTSNSGSTASSNQQSGSATTQSTPAPEDSYIHNGDLVAIRTSTFNTYCSQENDKGNVMNCNRSNVGDWEKFIINTTGLNSLDSTGSTEITLYSPASKKFCRRYYNYDNDVDEIRCDFDTPSTSGSKFYLKTKNNSKSGVNIKNGDVVNIFTDSNSKCSIRIDNDTNTFKCDNATEGEFVRFDFRIIKLADSNGKPFSFLAKEKNAFASLYKNPNFLGWKFGVVDSIQDTTVGALNNKISSMAMKPGYIAYVQTGDKTQTLAMTVLSNVANFNFSNDIVSLKIIGGPSCHAVLYDGFNYSGSKIDLSYSVSDNNNGEFKNLHNISGDWANKIDSIKVLNGSGVDASKCYVELYRKQNFVGSYDEKTPDLIVTGENYNLNANDIMSKIYFIPDSRGKGYLWSD